MKIAIDGRYAEENITGIGKYIYGLSTYLLGKGHAVYIFYTKKPKHLIPKSKIVIFTTKNNFIFEQYYVPKFILKNKINIYHATNNTGIPLFKTCKYILTIHDLIPLDTRDYFIESKHTNLSKIYYWIKLTISVINSNKIISVSTSTKKSLMAKFGIFKNKIITIGEGVIFLPSQKKEIIDNKFTNLIKNRYILNFGGIEKRKNIEMLIKSFELFYDKYPEFFLVITGKVNNPLLKNIVSKKVKNNIIFTDHLNDRQLIELIKNAKCTCNLSLIEGFGLPIIESIYFKVPVVASKIDTFKEISERAICFVNQFSSKDVFEGLEKTIFNHNYREYLINEGQKINKRYDWQNFGKEIENLYHTL